MRNTLGLFIIGISILIGCVHQPDTIPPGNGNGSGNGSGGNTSGCSTDTVYFQRDILPLLISNCAMSGCHDAVTQADGVNLTTYAKIIQTGEIVPFSPNNSELYEKITEDNPDKIMPPAPRTKLTAAQIALVNKWILQGAKNNNCTACDTTNIKYSTKVKTLIQTHCQGCHSGSSPSGGINLSTYTGIKTVASNGKLMGSVKRLSGFSPMPKGGTKLPDCEITILQKWVSAGAPNN